MPIKICWWKFVQLVIRLCIYSQENSSWYMLVANFVNIYHEEYCLDNVVSKKVTAFTCGIRATCSSRHTIGFRVQYRILQKRKRTWWFDFMNVSKSRDYNWEYPCNIFKSLFISLFFLLKKEIKNIHAILGKYF